MDVSEAGESQVVPHGADKLSVDNLDGVTIPTGEEKIGLVLLPGWKGIGNDNVFAGPVPHRILNSSAALTMSFPELGLIELVDERPVDRVPALEVIVSRDATVGSTGNSQDELAQGALPGPLDPTYNIEGIHLYYLNARNAFRLMWVCESLPA